MKRYPGEAKKFSKKISEGEHISRRTAGLKKVALGKELVLIPTFPVWRLLKKQYLESLKSCFPHKQTQDYTPLIGFNGKKSAMSDC